MRLRWYIDDIHGSNRRLQYWDCGCWYDVPEVYQYSEEARDSFQAELCAIAEGWE